MNMDWELSGLELVDQVYWELVREVTALVDCRLSVQDRETRRLVRYRLNENLQFLEPL